MEQIEKMNELRANNLKKIEEITNKNTDKLEQLMKEHREEKERLKEAHKKEIEEIKQRSVEERSGLKEELSRLENILLDSKLDATEAGSQAKDMVTRLEEMREKYDSLIAKVDELSEKNRVLNEDINRLNKIIDNLSTWKQNNINKISFFDRLTILMEQEPLFKAFLVIMEVGSIGIEDLQKATAGPIVLIKKYVEQLQTVDLVHINEMGKIQINDFTDDA
jgi:chromosome segregation ATPase